MPSAHSRSRNARKPQRRRQRSYDTVPVTPEEVDGATSGQTSSSDVSDEDDNFQHQRGSGPTSEHRYGSAVRPRRTPEDVGQALSGRTFHESDELDVIIYTFADEVCLEDQIHIKSLVELDDFFRNSQTSAAKHDFLVLIEDISDKIAQVIDQYSKTNQDTAKEHVRGRVNGKERLGTHSLHSDRLHTTLFDHYGRDENRDSLTWWRLFSHSRNGYTREKEALDGCDADTRRVTVPHFELQISDTHQGKIPTKTDLRDLGMRATLSHQWSEVRKKARNTQPSKDDDKPSTGSGPDPEILQFKVNTYRIIPHTYRPHQVITETSDDMWGAAGEERITCNWFENNDSTYYILLFDKPRTYRHIIQNFRHGEATEFNPGEPILSYEEPSDVLPTFLSAEALPNKKPKLPRTKTPIAAGGIYRHVASVASTNRSPAPRRRKQLDRATANLRQDSLEELPSQEPTSQLPVSTRSRFIEEATRAGLLRQSKSVAQERDQVLHRVRLAFAKMAAEDWNLVLSQMALTLDDIDAKMSDNTLLQTNALAWRRLLCSWRVSLVEYATRLLEIKTKLQPLQTTDASLFESTTRASEVIGARTDTTILEEEQKLLQLYQILVDGLHKIEQRVDRSFQAIMSSMSILESEKAIAQGAAITRLTELAFFFIPLSFAATFFSMQIQVRALDPFAYHADMLTTFRNMTFISRTWATSLPWAFPSLYSYTL
jgi:Mg2+ and Co2+ transporter CorA